MSAATIIKSTDANVPVLSGTEGSLAALIRYIAPILGWEIMFDNGPVIVVRPQSYKGGQVLLYRFDDRAARGGAAPLTAEVRAYESMPDINTGAGLVGPVYIAKSPYASTLATAWRIVGDQYGFYFKGPVAHSSWGNTQLSRLLMFFGFCNNHVGITDTPVCVLCGMADNVSDSGSWPKMSTIYGAEKISIPYMYEHYNISGAKNTAVCMCINGGPHPANKTVGETEISPKMPAYNGTILLLGRPYLNDGVPYSLSQYPPGLFYPCHSSGFIDDAIILHDGVEIYCMSVYGMEMGLSGTALIDIGLGFRA